MYLASSIARPPMEGPDAFVTHVPDYPDLRGLGCVSDPALPLPSYNHSGAPYPGLFASANSCYFRPLPVTPPLEVNMSVRPSSSRGPGSKNSASSSFKYDKRISRDDSFVNLRAGAGTGFKPHAFARGQLPTPETSPRHSPPRKTSIPTVRMPTPESLNEGSFAEIGMALGSPTTNPANGVSLTPQATLRAQQAPTPSLVSPASGISNTGSLTRKPTGKWKLFGRFGKKPSDHSLATSSEQKGTQRPDQPHDIASQQWYDTRVERSNTVNTRGTPKHKPLVVRSQTMPYDPESAAQGSKSKSRLDDATQETFGRIPIALDTNQNSSGPLLDVEIPNITMERYSVMFGSVLQSQPSLLARRQATVQRLKSIEDAVEKEQEEKHRDLPRRATSPAATRSPTFALFPPTPAKKPVHAPSSTASPRMRSNTSPAELHSPLKVAFEHGSTPNRQQHQQLQQQKQLPNDKPKTHRYKEPPTHAYQKGKLTIATLARARDQHPVAREHQFSPDSSNLILESPTDLSSPELEVVKAEAVRPRVSYMQEPKWQMMTPPTHTPSTASSSLTSDRKQPPSSPASSTHSSKTSNDEDDILENSAKMNPVELSIARQISISRQQRKMLKPLRTASARTPSKQTPVPKIAMGKDERFVDAKTKTPTLVTPEETNNPYRAQFRKSERVVLDEA
ncbi:hypothetical protein K449DRAFT_93950 [Hypoxylon sp. EC38]|nr:hypothetical protein K449DRAFT_93950 [Hypoxylon sp. EC38]